MPFEPRDFQDLIRLLREHPDWREELRVLLLTQKLLTLPTLVRELAETVAHLADRMDQLTQTVADLAVRLDQLTARVDQLTQTVAHLAEEQRRMAEEQGRLAEEQRRMAEEQRRLAEEQRRMAEEQGRLTEGQQRFEVQMGEMRGWFLEERYRTHAPAYFGRFLRQVQPVHIGRLADALRERLQEGELAEVLLADLILTGRLPTPPGPAEIWVVLEVSATVDRGDVERAQRRAAVLRQARYPAVAVAAGTETTAGARQVAGEVGVALLFDGRIDGWQEALDRMLAEWEPGAQSR
jgi:cell division protein FtsB